MASDQIPEGMDHCTAIECKNFVPRSSTRAQFCDNDCCVAAAEPEAVLQEAADLRAQAAATPNATAEVGAGAIPQATVEALV